MPAPLWAGSGLRSPGRGPLDLCADQRAGMSLMRDAPRASDRGRLLMATPVVSRAAAMLQLGSAVTW